MDIHKDIKPENKKELGIKNNDPVGFFQKDKDFFFSYKKTEKLVTALYMVTNFFSDHEPLKWNLRELAVSLLSLQTSLKEKFLAGKEERDAVLDKIKLSVLEIVSLLEISFFAGYVSEMNFSILKTEFGVLLTEIDTKQKAKFAENKFLFPDNFFLAVENTSFSNEGDNVEGSTPAVSTTGIVSNEIHKDNIKGHSRGLSRAKHYYKGQEQSSKTNIDHVENKNSSDLDSSNSLDIKKKRRQDIIMNLLNKKKELIIKDISEVVKDCSEKTIQRELLALVKSGVLNKEGERRWSRYSLAIKDR